MHYWLKSYGGFAGWVNFACWWSFSSEGSASAACKVGLFVKVDQPTDRQTDRKIDRLTDIAITRLLELLWASKIISVPFG